MPGKPVDWNPILSDFIDKEVILVLEGAPVEPFSAMKGVIKDTGSEGLWKLLCKSGRGPNGEIAPGGTLYFGANEVHRIMDQSEDPTPRLAD